MNAPDAPDAPAPAQLLSKRQRELVERSLDVVARAASIVARQTGARREDLVSAGNEALVAAAVRFEPELGVPFAGFAWKHVQGRMIRAAYAESGKRLADQIAKHLDVGAGLASDDDDSAPLHAPRETLTRSCREAAVAAVVALGAGPTHSAESDVIELERQATVRRVLASLDDQQRALIEAIYVESRTVDEVAEKLGLSPMTTRRSHARLKELLAKRLRAAQIVSSSR